METPSDELIKVHLDLPNHWWFKGESLWAKPLGDDLYEIQNIPFCAYGLNCGDVVRATADAPDLKPEVRSVVRPSGNETLRLSFNLARAAQEPVLAAIVRFGAWTERANDSFVCVNVPPSSDAAELRAYLNEQDAAGALEYETCEPRVPGSFDDAPDSASPDEED